LIPGKSRSWLNKKTVQYPIREWKTFLIFVSVPAGTLHIDESVFAFILAGNLQNFIESGIEQSIHHLYGYLVHPHQ